MAASRRLCRLRRGHQRVAEVLDLELALAGAADVEFRARHHHFAHRRDAPLGVEALDEHAGVAVLQQQDGRQQQHVDVADVALDQARVVAGGLHHAHGLVRVQQAVHRHAVQQRVGRAFVAVVPGEEHHGVQQRVMVDADRVQFRQLVERRDPVLAGRPRARRLRRVAGATLGAGLEVQEGILTAAHGRSDRGRTAGGGGDHARGTRMEGRFPRILRCPLPFHWPHQPGHCRPIRVSGRTKPRRAGATTGFRGPGSEDHIRADPGSPSGAATGGAKGLRSLALAALGGRLAARP